MGNPKLKIRFFKVSAVFLAVIIPVLFFEVYLRIRGPKYYRFNERSDEYYTNPRDYHIPLRREGANIVYGLRYRESPQGYRLPGSISYVKDEQEKLSNFILGIGDSFAYGQGVKYRDLYLTRLEKLLNGDNYQVSIKNCGLDGVDLDRILEVYLLESAQQSWPLVIYGFVLNDFLIPKTYNIVGSDFIDINNGGNRWNFWRNNFATINLIAYAIEKRRLHDYTLRAYLDSFRGEGARSGFKLLRELNRSIKSKGSSLVIVLFPLIYNFKNYPFKEIHDKISSFCIRENIPLLDLLPAFSKYKPEELWVNPTDYHPNELAHKIASDNIYVFLKDNNLLETLTGRYQIKAPEIIQGYSSTDIKND